jgi:WD40 repeat protein
MPNEVTDSRVIARESAALVCGEDGVGRTVIGPGRMPERLGTQVNCTSLDASEDGLLAATGYADGSVRAWRTDGARFASSLPHTAAVIMVRFLPESRHLLSIDGAGIIRVWDLSPAAPPRTVDRGYTWKAGFSPDGRRLALASGSSSRPYVGQGTIVDAATSEMRLPPLRHNGNVFDVAFSPDGRLIATASDDGTARLWDATSGEPVSDELAQDGRFVQVLFSSDGHRLLTLGSAEGPAGFPALLWEVPTARLIASLPGTEQVRAGEFSPDGQHLMIVTQTMNSKRVQIWRAGDGQPVSGASWPCDAAAFVSNTSASLEVRNVDGRILATHDTATPTPVAVIRTNDGSAVVVLTDGGTSHVWNLRPSVAPRFPAWRLSGAMTAGGVSRDDRWFVGASWQRRMRVWSMETGEAMTPDRPVALLPLSASFSPVDSSFQVSGLGATRWELGADTRPDGLLERLVRLISGHELVGTELVPLSVARLIDLARDPALAVNPPPAIARNWRWLVATEHLRKREWAAAEIGLAALANEPEAILEAHVQHGFALAELGRWSESARAFETALARDPDSTELIYYEALALAAGGDAGAIDRGCRGSLQKFGATRNPDRAHWLASLCVLGDAADSTATARVRELSRIAADLEPDIERFATVHATALIQDHQPSSAAALLDKVLELPALRDRGAHTLLVYALAQRTLGQNRAASESLARFETSPLRSTMPWHRRFEAETWLRQLKTGK